MAQEQNPDAGLGVEFFVKAVENAAKTREEGRPIYDDREYIRIAFPGDGKRELIAPANEMHFNGNPGVREQMTYAERFAASYAAFKEERSDFVSGTPLMALPGITEAEQAELKALKINTVEQLAGLASVGRKKLGISGNKLIPLAEKYLSGAQARSEVDSLKARIAELEAAQTGPMSKTVQAPPGEYDGFEDEDLKNMIRDAGGQIPPGNAARVTLIKRLNEMAEEKENA